MNRKARRWCLLGTLIYWKMDVRLLIDLLQSIVIKGFSESIRVSLENIFFSRHILRDVHRTVCCVLHFYISCSLQVSNILLCNGDCRGELRQRFCVIPLVVNRDLARYGLRQQAEQSEHPFGGE